MEQGARGVEREPVVLDAAQELFDQERCGVVRFSGGLRQRLGIRKDQKKRRRPGTDPGHDEREEEGAVLELRGRQRGPRRKEGELGNARRTRTR